MQNSLLVFGTENFNESLNEIEDHLILADLGVEVASRISKKIKIVIP